MSAIVPPSRPKLSREEAIKILIAAHPEYEQYKNGVVILSLRGYYEDTMGKPGQNDVNLYDDAFCVITPDKFYTVNANTDPSKIDSTIAQLIPGLHFFKKGKHGISHADGGYPAFRPDTPDEGLPVMRGGKLSRGIAINMHKGGYNTTSSLGCQTAYPDQWLAYQRDVYALMDKYHQHRLPYFLIDVTKK